MSSPFPFSFRLHVLVYFVTSILFSSLLQEFCSSVTRIPSSRTFSRSPFSSYFTPLLPPLPSDIIFRPSRNISLPASLYSISPRSLPSFFLLFQTFPAIPFPATSIYLVTFDKFFLPPSSHEILSFPSSRNVAFATKRSFDYTLRVLVSYFTVTSFPYFFWVSCSAPLARRFPRCCFRGSFVRLLAGRTPFSFSFGSKRK